MIHRFGKWLFICRTENTSYGFRHLVDVYFDEGEYPIASGKCTYHNRTWESYTFQTVILKAVENITSTYISTKDREKLQGEIK